MIENIVATLQNKKIAIVGFGLEGKSTYTFLKKYCKPTQITILDKNPIVLEDQVTIITGENYLRDLDSYDIIFKTPGIVINRDVPYFSKITSQLELLLEYASKQVIGITGTKGKSTTSSLLYQVLKDQGKDVYLVGNVGIPIFDQIEKYQKNSILVVEMSSHQLEFVHKSPHIGLILNLYEDHLDHAGSVEAYYQSKLNIVRYQTENDICIYDAENMALCERIKKTELLGRKETVTFKKKEQGIYLEDHYVIYQDKVLYSDRLKRNLIGKHNLKNIMFVLLLAQLLQLDLKKVIDTITHFKPLENRLEFVGCYQEVSYYCDTIATIPEATISAIEALKNVNTLIFGGMDRGISYEQLISYLMYQKTIEHLICMPETGTMIGHILKQQNCLKKIYNVKSLKEAVILAKKWTKKGTICLLSPAASSYNQFQNYQEKGMYFKQYVKEGSCEKHLSYK